MVAGLLGAVWWQGYWVLGGQQYGGAFVAYAGVPVLPTAARPRLDVHSSGN